MSIAVLAAHVFLDTYAKEGVHQDLAREVVAGYSPKAFASRVADQRTSFVLAEISGGLIGFTEVTQGNECPVPSVIDAVELVRLYVHPGFHRRGFGASLLRRAEHIASSAGAGSLWLTAWSGNARALAFYRDCGYQTVGVTGHVIEGKTYENQVLVKCPLVFL